MVNYSLISLALTYPPDYVEFFEARQYQYTRLGLRAIIRARQLRKFAGLPNTRLDATPWSAQNVLWKEWRQERNRRHNQAVLMARSLATLHIVNQMRNDNQSNADVRPEDTAVDPDKGKTL